MDLFDFDFDITNNNEFELKLFTFYKGESGIFYLLSKIRISQPRYSSDQSDTYSANGWICTNWQAQSRTPRQSDFELK